MLNYIKNMIRNLQFLVTHRISVEEENLIFRIKDEVLEDAVFQLPEDSQIIVKLDIKDEWETIELLQKQPRSFCRMGDGEIRLINGEDQAFQVYDESLARKLLDILENKQENMYVGINRAYFHSVRIWGEENQRFYRIYGTELRRFFMEHCNPQNEYIDAGFNSSYFRYKDDYNYELHYSKLKELFRDKDILLVVGEGVINKLDYDIFEYVNSKEYIYGPNKHAYEKYEWIINMVLDKVKENQIVCVILGMAGKAMVKDLTDHGLMVWDIGHMAKDYDAYMKRIEKNHANTRKFYAPD